MKIYKQKYTEESVLEAARRRMLEAFTLVDRVVVSFSGGKDSTVVLNLALEAATQLGKLPLEVIFFDEEAIHPPTIEYVERVAALPSVDFRWYCPEMKHRNACSNEEPYWHCWEAGKEHLWVREFPKTGIAHLPGWYKGMDIEQLTASLYRDYPGSVGVLIGLRAQESIRRLRVVSNKIGDNWMSDMQGNVRKMYPIYDWKTQDVWRAPHLLGWDTNSTYKVFELAGVPISKQRVCPPFGEEPLRGLHQYALCFPDMWEKMCDRVPGARTAARYANTPVYGIGLNKPPEGITWEVYTEICLGAHPENIRAQIEASINQTITAHYRKSILEIRDDTPDPITGCCHRLLCQMAIKGDLKNRTVGNMNIKSERAPERREYTFDKCVAMWGTDDYKQRYFGNGKA